MSWSRATSRAIVLLVAVAAAVTVPIPPGAAAAAPPPQVVSEILDGIPVVGAAETADAPAAAMGGDAAGTSEDPDRMFSAADAAAFSEAIETPIPFNMVGFVLPPGTDHVDVRARVAGEWSEWYRAEAQDLEDAPDPGTAEAAGLPDPTTRTDPVWFGESDAIQLRTADVDPADVQVMLIDSLGLSEGFFARIGRHLSTRPAPAEAQVAPFPYVTRAGWGADESIRKGSPSYAANVQFTVIHHTAGGNTYTRDQAPGVVRGIYEWHVKANGWNDIGYNFLVDRYGTIYEGRFGGIDRGVIGAHAGGWNTGSFGISLMGNYNSATPTVAELDAFARVIAWKYRLHGISATPSARVFVNSQWIPTLVGHRNVRGSYQVNPSTTTDCPGQNFYVRLDNLRDRVEAASIDVTGGIPVSGDWNGDGRTTGGWFVDGQWYLTNTNGPTTSMIRVRYGRAGDLPVPGDWNGDGRTTLGIIRDGTWHLKDSLAGGAADWSFRYGRVTQGDVPLVGDWNGDGRDTVGIVRVGQWHLRNSLAGGPADQFFTYGRVLQGDVPVIGDWDGSGRVGVGIVRDGMWHLRYTLSGGNADVAFRYGAATDLPVVGDWNRNGVTTVGVVRGQRWLLRNSNSGGAENMSFTFP
jgi:hypothetical protein